jgi:hypothetical protein
MLNVPVIRYDLFLFSFTPCVVIRRITTSWIFLVCIKVAFTYISMETVVYAGVVIYYVSKPQFLRYQYITD